jgi:hypothetical protein
MVENERLRELRLACPDCGTEMSGTGRMHYSRTIGRWLVEYWCPLDKEMREIWTPQAQPLTEELAR